MDNHPAPSTSQGEAPGEDYHPGQGEFDGKGVGGSLPPDPGSPKQGGAGKGTHRQLADTKWRETEPRGQRAGLLSVVRPGEPVPEGNRGV